jgi:peptide/nickel transport system permease protein
LSNIELIERPVVATTAAETRAERRLAVRARLRYAIGKLDLILSLLVVAVFIVISFFPSVATSLDPVLADPRVSFQAPNATHWFGTDELGRDSWARVVYGASLSLSAASFAVLLSFVIGTILGVIAGTAGGWIDALIMRVFDAVLAIPGLLMVFAILAVLGNGVMNIALAIGIAGSVSFGRVMRGEVLSVRSSTYVEAAGALGVRPFGIVTRHIIPNAITPLISLAALEFGTAMLTIGAMGYLGFGAEPPLAEWGALIADGQKFIRTAWWLGVLPGIVFVIVVLAVNRISRVVGQRGNTNA